MPFGMEGHGVSEPTFCGFSQRIFSQNKKICSEDSFGVGKHLSNKEKPGCLGWVLEVIPSFVVIWFVTGIPIKQPVYSIMESYKGSFRGSSELLQIMLRKANAFLIGSYCGTLRKTSMTPHF